MLTKTHIKDAVSYRVKCQGAGFSELAEAGVTREEIEMVLDRRYNYADEETISKLKKWLDRSDSEIIELARLYKAQLASTAIYNLLVETCQTEASVEETAEFLIDFVGEIKSIAKGRFN